jgi:hypothetical protein
MSQNNRNATRERKGEEPKRFELEDERRYSSNQQEGRTRSMARVNAERTDDRSSDRENDLYERQSI